MMLELLARCAAWGRNPIGELLLSEGTRLGRGASVVLIAADFPTPPGRDGRTPPPAAGHPDLGRDRDGRPAAGRARRRQLGGELSRRLEGRSTSWSWLNNVAIPACLAWPRRPGVAAGQRGDQQRHRPARRPAVLGLRDPGRRGRFAAALVRRWARAAAPWYWWSPALTVIGVIGAGVTAATVSQPDPRVVAAGGRSPPRRGRSTAIAPPSPPRPRWLVTAVTWGRGLWLGIDPPRYVGTTWSASLASLMFVGIFSGRAARPRAPRSSAAT